MCATTKGTTRFFNERPILSQPGWQSRQFGFLGRTATWLYAGFSGEIPACGDVLTMNATRAASVHRRFLVCYAEVLVNCNEETSWCSRRLLQLCVEDWLDTMASQSQANSSAIEAWNPRLFFKVTDWLFEEICARNKLLYFETIFERRTSEQ